MTRKEYLKIKDILDEWSNGKTIGLATSDNKNILDSFRDVNPFEHYKSKRMVINDEYIELRLAIMRGETIEYKNRSNSEWIEMTTDVSPARDFMRDPEGYRVRKPDISWVENGVYATCLGWSSEPIMIQVTQNGEVHFDNKISWNTKEEFVKECKKWEPRKDEVCWFWNDKTLPVLRQFNDMDKKIFVSSDGAKYSNCLPYIGKKFWE